MALNVFHEARGEGIRGQILVAQVTMNRAHQKSAEVCRVVTAKLQFSWTQHCITPSKWGWKLLDRCIPKEPFAWETAKRVAVVALQHAFTLVTCADHFFGSHATQPLWTRKMVAKFKYGNHFFYTSKRALLTCKRKS
jgi:spore germination cell wall hydrolase CwlJ-like protein